MLDEEEVELVLRHGHVELVILPQGHQSLEILRRPAIEPLQEGQLVVNDDGSSSQLDKDELS
jgi:hypothetical protein